MTFHGAAFVGSIAAFNKYGDKTELADKTLRGTREALDTLLAYLGSTLAQRVKPTIERILATATQKNGEIKEIKAEDVVEEFSGEAFRNDIGSFVNSGISELLAYRELVYSRDEWAIWAKIMSRGLLLLMFLEGGLALFFFVWKVMGWTLKPSILIATMAATGLLGGFCLACAGAMLYYHEKISEYRDKIL